MPAQKRSRFLKEIAPADIKVPGMLFQRLILSFAFLFLITSTAAAERAGESRGAHVPAENQLHVEVATGYQYFNPRALYEGLLTYGEVEGGGFTWGGGAAYNFGDVTIGLRFDQARTFPTGGVSDYRHWSLGPEVGWLRRFDPFVLHLALGYAYHRMNHYYNLDGEYGGGDLTTLGHALRPSATVRWSLARHLYLGLRAQFEVIAFHRNNSGTFLCDGDYSCDPEQSAGLSAGLALVLGTSF